MAEFPSLSNAATALTEGLQIYGDIQDRERRAQAEQDFADRVNAAGGVENLSYEDIINAGDVLSRKQMELGRYAIQQRQSADALEATRKYDEEKLLRERKYKKGVLEEKRGYEADILTDELARQATQKTAEDAATADLLTAKQSREDRLLSERLARQTTAKTSEEVAAAELLTEEQAREDLLRTQEQERKAAILTAKEASTAELLSDKRTREDLLRTNKQDREDRLRTERLAREAALRQEGVEQNEAEKIVKEEQKASEEQEKLDAIASVTALSKKYGGMNFIPKIELLPFTGLVDGLNKYMDPKRTVGGADEPVDEVSQMMRDSVFDGDFAEARRIGRKAGISKSGVNAELKTIKTDFSKAKNAREVLNRVEDIINLPDEDFGVKGQAKDVLSSFLGAIGFGGKPSVFANKMQNITVDYATEKLKGVLSDQDMNRVQSIIGDSGILRKGPEEVRQIMGEIQDILGRSIEQLRTGKMIKRADPNADFVDEDVTLSTDDEALINKYLPGGR